MPISRVCVLVLRETFRAGMGASVWLQVMSVMLSMDSAARAGHLSFSWGMNGRRGRV